MRRSVILLLILGVLPAGLRAQGSTAETLKQAKSLYENLDVERALLLLRQIISPSSPFEVTPAQRVDAYKYIGASLAFTGMRDSAIVYFRAALERDPFTDLNPQDFTPAQLAALAAAKRLTFAVGGRPIASARFGPRTDPVSFVVQTTHAAALRVEIRGRDDSLQAVLFNGESEGLRDLPWSGMVASGAMLAPPGRYRLWLIAQSRLTGDLDSAWVPFVLAHEHAPLEDTIPDLEPSELLTEQRPSAAARRGLLAGLGVAASALIISTVVSDQGLQEEGPVFAAAAGGIGALTGLAGFVWQLNHRSIAANIAENHLRRSKRSAAKTEVARRNEQRVSETVLLISPITTPGGQ